MFNWIKRLRERRIEREAAEFERRMVEAIYADIDQRKQEREALALAVRRRRIQPDAIKTLEAIIDGKEVI